MATIAAVVTAAAGAYAANRQAAAANKPRTGSTDQTTEQTPYHGDLIEPDLNDVLWRQRMLADQGVPQVDANGNLFYAQHDQLGTYAPSTPAPATGAARGGKGSVPAGMRVNKAGKLVVAKGSAAGAGGAGGAGRPGAPAGPDLSTPQGVFQEVARRGLETGNTATVGQARNAVGNILGGTGTKTGTDPSATGFEGYNPILARQAQRLEDDADNRAGRDLLLGFLGEDGRGGSGSGNPGGSNSAGSGRSSLGGAGVSYGYTGGTGGAPTPMYGGPGGPNSGVPDTLATDSYFGTQTRQMMDEGANDAELQGLIDAMNKDSERGFYRAQADLDATATGAGRFGGDMWKGQSSDARRDALDAMNRTSAGVRVGDRESRRQAKLSLLAGVNQRDLGLLGANVQREGIAAGERSASAASGANAQAAADQLALARRGQDLSAIGSLLDYEQFGLGQISGIGGQLSSDQLSALGLVPGLEGVGLSGLQTTLGAGGGMADLRGQSLQAGAARQAANLQQQGLNLQRSGFNAGMGQSQVNDYLATLRNIGSLGGTSHTFGSNVQPGLGVNPNAAMIQGAVGGGLAGYGAVAGR